MPVNRVRRLGSFAPLSANAYKDDALAAAGQAAELLFYRGLSFAADVIEDGFITDSQLSRLLGWDMRDVRKRADRLVEVGLWTRGEGGYWIRSWLKWNRSKDEIQSLRRIDAGRKGSKSQTPNGDSDPPGSESERNPNGIQSESDTPPNGFRPTHTEPHTEPEPTPEPESEAKSSVPVGAETFARFWSAYPKRTGRKEAERKWAKAIKDGADPEVLIAAAGRYAESRSGQDSRFTAHPATWLHQGRWDDEQPALRLVANGYQAFRNSTDPDAYEGDLLP